MDCTTCDDGTPAVTTRDDEHTGTLHLCATHAADYDYERAYYNAPAGWDDQIGWACAESINTDTYLHVASDDVPRALVAEMIGLAVSAALAAPDDDHATVLSCLAPGDDQIDARRCWDVLAGKVRVALDAVLAEEYGR